MESKKTSDVFLDLIDRYRLVREDDFMLYICSRMERAKSTCEKVKLSKEIDALLREVLLKYDEHQRLRLFAKSFLPLSFRVIRCSLEVSFMFTGWMILAHLLKQNFGVTNLCETNSILHVG